MAVRPFTRIAAATAASVVAIGLVAASTGSGTATASGGVVERKKDTNPTGTNAGSLPNGAGNLKVSLAPTADGRIRVSWKRPGPARNLKKFVVTVGPNRALLTRTRLYNVSNRKQSIVVDRAVDAVPTSGNYTFVRVASYRKQGGHGGSPAKWIQAPITSTCTAAAQDQVKIADFNVRTWTADKEAKDPIAKWSTRGPNVIAEILQSGARAISVQESSGAENPDYGNKTQYAWIVDQLNAADPDPMANWVDALTPLDYKAPPGRTPGLIGTRIFYDANAFTKLASGLKRMVVAGWAKDSLVPWARLQSTSGTQSPFVLTSNHLRVGTGDKEYQTRVKQTGLLIDIVKDLRAQFNDTVFVVGDLNSTANDKPMNYPQQQLLRAGLYDSYATTNLVNPKYPSTNALIYPVVPTPLRRDYILTYGPVKGSCGYVNQTYQTKAEEASDHFLQVAVLPLPAL